MPAHMQTELKQITRHIERHIGPIHTVFHEIVSDDLHIALANGESEPTTQPYAEGTSLCAAVLLPPPSLGEAAWSFKRADGQEVFLWAAVPLHMNELKFKLEHGVDPLLDLFDQKRVTDRIDPTRPSVVQ